MALLHIVSWNVNGLRSVFKKDFITQIEALKPHILCLQETKASVNDVKALCEALPQYKIYANESKARKGYSGTAILTLVDPELIVYDIEKEDHNHEGRVITAEYEKFFFVTVYAPNAGDGLKRLEYRRHWDLDFKNYVLKLEQEKPVIIAGDLNVAHKPIDISRPKENYNKSAGYSQAEIDGMDAIINAGFTDTFRHLYPEEVKYTWWNQLFNARARNRGWRIDYTLVSNKLLPKVKDSVVYSDYMGSDHCPIGLFIEI